MAVVNREQHGRSVGEVDHQPVEAVKRLEVRVHSGTSPLVGLEQARRRRGRTGE